jgi:GAG-pre-integrase domain
MKFCHTAKECYYRYDDDSSPSPQVNLAQPVSSPTTDWFLVSGASSHIVPDLNCLTSYTPYQGNDVVRVGNGHGLPIFHTGTSFLSTGQHNLILDHVLHVPNITKRLLSISRLTRDNNIIVEFTNYVCVIKDLKTHMVLLEGGISQGLYCLPSFAALLCDISPGDLWHHRLGHTSYPVLQHLQKTNLIFTVSFNSPCDSCSKFKSHRLSFSLSSNKASKPLELVHVDVWGPSPVISSLGNRFYILFVDDFSRFSWLFTCSAKSQVADIFAGFKAKVENLLSSSSLKTLCHTPEIIKRIRGD